MIVTRRLAAILAADVVGYSGLMERGELTPTARLLVLRLLGRLPPVCVVLSFSGRYPRTLNKSGYRANSSSLFARTPRWDHRHQIESSDHIVKSLWWPILPRRPGAATFPLWL